MFRKRHSADDWTTFAMKVRREQAPSDFTVGRKFRKLGAIREHPRMPPPVERFGRNRRSS